MPRAGERRPYRPMPADFAERFIRTGWGGAELEFGAHKRTIRRWLAEAGATELALRRRAYLDEMYGRANKRTPGSRPRSAG